MTNQQIKSYLEFAETQDLECSRLLNEHRKATSLIGYHLSQAAEKILKAARLHAGLRIDKGHRLRELLEGGPGLQPLPANSAWHGRFEPLVDRLDPHATQSRYPLPSGKLKPGPLGPGDSAELIEAVEKLLELAKKELL